MEPFIEKDSRLARIILWCADEERTRFLVVMCIILGVFQMVFGILSQR